jgi:hypothetical protein
MSNSKVPKTRLGPLNIGSADIGSAGLPVSILSAGSATAGQALIYNGTAYVPTSLAVSTTFVDAEVPVGTKNGNNVTFTLAGTPSPSASLQLFVGGLLMTPGTAGDFTIGTATITMSVAPGVNDTILAYYRK